VLLASFREATITDLVKCSLSLYDNLNQGCQTRFSSGATSGKFYPKGPDQCNQCITPWL